MMPPSGRGWAWRPTWQEIETAWQQLQSSESKLSADDAVARHDVLIARIVKLGNLVTARSGLNVDPSPQTASLIRIATRDVPGALIASGNVQWYATRASIKGYLGGDDQMALHLYHDEVAGDFAATARDLNGAPASGAGEIAPALEARAGRLRQLLLDHPVADHQRPEDDHHDRGALRRLARHQLEPAATSRTSAYSAMDAAVKQRLSQVTTWRNLTAGVTVARPRAWRSRCPGSSPARSPSPLAQAIEVFGRIAAGKYDNAIDLSGSDEAGRVLRALDDMQGKLRSQIENERLVAAENARVRQALDKVSTSVVLADDRSTASSTSTARRAPLSRAASRRSAASLPGFDVAAAARLEPGDAVGRSGRRAARARRARRLARGRAAARRLHLPHRHQPGAR